MNDIKRRIGIFVCLSLPLASLSLLAQTPLTADQTLWFNYPAQNWSTQALHLGNGYMGASFYGEVKQERFDLAEKTFWTGGPHSSASFNYGLIEGGKDQISLIRKMITDGHIAAADSLSNRYLVGDYSNYGAFSMVGNLFLDFGEQQDTVSNYVRGLDLANSLGFVNYRQGGVNYSREYFCSYPNRLLAMHLTTDQKHKVDFTLSYKLINAPDETSTDSNRMVLKGLIRGNGLRYCIRIEVSQQGGSVTYANQRITVKGANQATILYTVDTEYKQQYPLYKGEDPVANTQKVMQAATAKSYETIKQSHLNDYHTLYNRVKFSLRGDEQLEKLPTNERVEALRRGTVDDSSLKAVWFNLSRYLVISASRPGTLPSTLQGVWNTFEMAPWSGNFQSNINLQEMYWSCGPTNLPECEEAYITWIEGLVESGRQTARSYYGTKGWVSHSTGNIWGHTVPGNEILWGLYPVGAAWHCRHLWEHYAFTGDKQFLDQRAYPVMKEAALFWLENMVAYQGGFIVAPSVSAEHGIELKNGVPVDLSTVNGEEGSNKLFTTPAFQDIEMVYDLYTHVIEASKVLNIDSQMRSRLLDAKEKLIPLRIGKYGQLQEWLTDVDNPRDYHRHVAHLYALYPGNMISLEQTPELARAAEKSLEMRSEGKKGDKWPHTGGNWSMAWRSALWTRLQKGDRAIRVFNTMIRDSGYENMMSNQSGNMQVDATMATSGIFAEMLLQSQNGVIHLLPALPTEWPEGKIQGLIARGGYVVNIEWKQGQLTQAEITVPAHAPTPSIRIMNQAVGKEEQRVKFL